MDNQRLFLFFGLALVLMLLWQAWEQENARPPDTTTVTATSATQPGAAPDVPKAPAAATEAVPAPKAAEVLSRGSRLEVRTDVIDAVIDTQGGDLRGLALRHFPVAAYKP